LGYRFGQTLSVELGYAYLGKATFTSTTNVSTVTGHVKGELWNIDAVGLWPMTQNLGFLARLGIYRWTASSEIPALAGGLMSTTDHGWDFKAGAGLQYDINKNFALRAEYERYNGIGDNNRTGDSKVNLLSAGAVLKF
jgi:OmpA-OmpF porin, OOP family